MNRALLPLSLLVAASCAGPDLQVFDVTIRTLRDCHPAGIYPELCEARSQFEGLSRTARFTLEMRGPTQFILYEDDGRAMPGNVERGHYFARQLHSTISPDGCHKTAERSVVFEIREDLLPTVPYRQRRRDRMVGTIQSRATQNSACGQATVSKREEAFEGDELRPDDPMPPLPPLPALPFDGGTP